MKSYTDIETGLLDASEGMKRTITALLCNAGRAIAIITATVTALAMFTDVSFQGIAGESFFSSLALLLTSAYIIYFSLEDAGEKLGERSHEYATAKERFDGVLAKIGGEDVEPMRAFCADYAARELEFRRKALMLSYGISRSMIEEYEKGELKDKRAKKGIRKLCSLRAAPLSPTMLLSTGKRQSREELRSPEGRRLPWLVVKLIPSTLCMTLTVSVMLTAKAGMTAADAINALLKLSSLPIIGFRGYSAGYSYVKNELSSWVGTKASILESYVKERDES